MAKSLKVKRNSGLNDLQGSKKLRALDTEYPLVLVDWTDAESEDSWSDLSTFDGVLPVVRTVGFLLIDSQDSIVVAQNFDPKNTQVSMVMTIPKGMIIRRMDLRVV
jgi:hypothetical protein